MRAAKLHSLRFFILLSAALALSACGTDEDAHKNTIASADKRIPVIISSGEPKANPDLSDFSLLLPEPAINKDWAQTGGNVGHAPENPAFNGEKMLEIWASSIGSGSNRNFKLLASPVIGGNVVYTMDSTGRVSAFDLTNGDRHWRVETTPSYREGEAMGGGVALERNVLYATTGFGEVLALRPADGTVIWRRALGKPVRSAPTVSEGRVFAITIDNETYALDAATGRVLWQHNGIAESAALMGASSPAVHGDTVVVAYSSGELFGLRAQNGRIVWGEVLAVPTQKGALPAIADIRGLPVIEKGRVFAISHSGRMVSIDERTGGRVWEVDLGGFNTPCVSGNALFVVTNNNELVALTRDKGQIIWITELQKRESEKEKETLPAIWSGPVLAGGKLWLTNSLGFVAAFAPETGKSLQNKEVADPFFMPPLVANRTMLLLSDDGRLRAFK